MGLLVFDGTVRSLGQPKTSLDEALEELMGAFSRAKSKFREK
jgi:hypothetical protein